MDSLFDLQNQALYRAAKEFCDKCPKCEKCEEYCEKGLAVREGRSQQIDNRK